MGLLPEAKVPATRINPKIFVMYSVPKVGKTSSIAQLDNCLLLDTEGGAEMYEALRVPIRSSTDLDNVYKEIMAIGTKAVAEGKKVDFPYKYIAIDTVDKLEDYCEISATRKYKESILGKKFEGNSILELPKGGGYYFLRNEVMDKIYKLASVCKYLIISAHVKDILLDKGGIEVTSRDLSLAGKLSQMVCAAADIIGYLYREPGNPDLMISFETFETTGAMGARFPRLAGKRMKFDWNTIYLPEPAKDVVPNKEVSK